MKRFFYIYIAPDGSIRLDSIQSLKYDDAIKELETNAVKVLYLSTYYGVVSRYLYKYFILLIQVHQDQLTDTTPDSLDWKIIKPYLYFNQKKQEFSVSDQMIFNDYSLQFIGYVPSKIFQDILTKNDF